MYLRKGFSCFVICWQQASCGPTALRSISRCSSTRPQHNTSSLGSSAPSVQCPSLRPPHSPAHRPPDATPNQPPSLNMSSPSSSTTYQRQRCARNSQASSKSFSRKVHRLPSSFLPPLTPATSRGPFIYRYIIHRPKNKVISSLYHLSAVFPVRSPSY